MRAYRKNNPERLIPERPVAENERLMIINGKDKPYPSSAKTISEAFEMNPSAIQVERVRVVHGEKGTSIEKLGSVTRPEIRKELSRYMKKD